MSLLAQDERLTRRVGAITLFVLAAGIAFAVFVAHRIEWGDRVRIKVYFHQTTALREGASFVVAGRTIGQIESIALSPRGAPGPLGGAEGVVVTVALVADEAARVMRGGDVFISSRGALSERYLEIGPSPEPTPMLTDGLELIGRDPPSLDRVLQRTWDNLTTTRQFAAEVRPELDLLRAQLRELGDTLDGLVPEVAGAAGFGLEVRALLAEARTLRDLGLGGEPGLARLEDVVTRARATLAQARTVLDSLGGKAGALGTQLDAVRARVGARGPAALRTLELAIARMRSAIDKVDPLLAQLEDLQRRIARGEGSIGKLMRDPEFPEDAKELGKIMKRQPWKILGRPGD